MITGLHHINIVVTDLEKAVRFFETLGFSVFERKHLKGNWIDEVTGLSGVDAEYAGLRHNAVPTAVELLKYNSPEEIKNPFISKPNSIGIRHFAFQIENIEEMIKMLESSGTEFFGSLQINPYGKKNDISKRSRRNYP